MRTNLLTIQYITHVIGPLPLPIVDTGDDQHHRAQKTVADL